VSLPPGAREARAVAGGDINEAFRVTLADGRTAFVKTRADVPAGEYAAEAAGLRWLAEPGALRTPRVLDASDEYLALEWIEQGRLSCDGGEQLGRGLALTHSAQAPRFGGFAVGCPNDAESPAVESGEVAWLASLRISNEPAQDWPTFYGERRLLPLGRLAREREAIESAGLRSLERVCGRLQLLTGPPEPPARLHGDLWQGNILADAQGRPWLIDPSAYGGHREVDLAMLALFGSPSRRMLDSYREVAPLAAGWQERVGLYQLLPLLVHALLFGGSYRDSFVRIARRYA
jgi:fructosamine-3-kinase